MTILRQAALNTSGGTVMVLKAQAGASVGQLATSTGTTLDLRSSDQRRQDALRVREKWMRLMGLPEEEIAEWCRPDVQPAPDLDEELRELAAAKRLPAMTPPREALLAWAKEHEAGQ
jgi:hypothetical protein